MQIPGETQNIAVIPPTTAGRRTTSWLLFTDDLLLLYIINCDQGEGRIVRKNI
jgi:hypothetical protein